MLAKTIFIPSFDVNNRIKFGYFGMTLKAANEKTKV